MKRGVLACGQEAAGGYLDLGGLPLTIAAVANDSLCLRPLVARHALSLSDFQSEFLHFSFRRPQKEGRSGLLRTGGGADVFSK